MLLAGGVPEGYAELLPVKPTSLVYAPALPDEGSAYDYCWDAKAATSRGKRACAWIGAALMKAAYEMGCQAGPWCA